MSGSFSGLPVLFADDRGKVLILGDRNITPSIACNDGRDYVPINKRVVFEYHFAAIAGDGPLIGSWITPKLIEKETQVRMVVSYGAMLI